MARQGSVIYPREAVDTLKSEPIGTGPTSSASGCAATGFVLVEEPRLPRQGLPRLDRVTYRFIPDPNAALAALKAGDVDAAMSASVPSTSPSSRRTRASR